MRSGIKRFLLGYMAKYSAWKHGIALISEKSTIRHVKFDKSTRGDSQTVNIFSGGVIDVCDFVLRGCGTIIEIGNNVNIHHTQFWVEDDNNSIIIGNGVTMEGGHIAVTGHNKKIVIGDDCMISNNVTIRTGDSHAILQDEIKINEEADVIIGKHVWIGNGATILKGVHIEDGAVIGSGSIVTTDVEANTIYAGNPVRKVKSNILWTRKRFTE